MGKLNVILKRVFIFFNAVFAGLGCVMIIGAMKASAYSDQLSTVGGPSVGWTWAFAIGFLGISCLGIYAGSSEKPLALKAFAGFMGIGMAIMLIFGIIIVDTRNKIKDSFMVTSNELTKHVMEEQATREMLDEIQKDIHCCGLVRAEDWGDSIPSSCDCKRSYSGECRSKPKGASGPNTIYQKTCGEFIYMSVSSIFEVTIGFCFTFAVIALLGLLISLLMIHQIKRTDQIGGGSAVMNTY